MKISKLLTSSLAIPLAFCASQSFALYCGTASNSEHESAGRAYSETSYSWWYSTTNYYAKGSNDSLSSNETLQETSPGYFEVVSSCSSGSGSTIPPTTSIPVGPDKTPDRNPENQLDEVMSFSGKNYQVAVAGSDLVADNNGDHQANSLSLPRTVSVKIPEGATVEAAFISYYGSAYLTANGGEDNTDDTVSGGELPIDNEAHIANNEINISIGNRNLGALTPSSVGGDSRSKTSWWKLHAAAGTLEDSRVAFYNNRLDLTAEFQGLSGEIPVTVTRLQRADFTGATDSRMEYYYGPAGNNGNGDRANDCLANASYSVIVIYSLPEGKEKTITLYDGVSWAWNNDFATNSSKAHNPISNPLALDINMSHDPVDAEEGLNVYIGTLDGDQFGHSGVAQCGSSSYPHDTGYDHTWVSSGYAQEEYYANIYEGDGAPEIGDSFTEYPNVVSVAKGLNYNVVKVALTNVDDGATTTKIHVEGDNPVSTTKEQEAMLVSFAIVEGTVLGQSEPAAPQPEEPQPEEPQPEEPQPEEPAEPEPVEPTNTAPTVTINGASSITLEYGATFTDPGATATDAEDGTLQVEPNCNVDTQLAGTYTCNYIATDSGGLSANATRIVIVEEEVVVPACTEYTATNSEHKSAGRAYSKTSGYWWYSSTSYYAKGSGDSLGSSYSTTTLSTQDGTSFTEASCP